MVTRVLIVEDSEPYARGLQTIMEATGEFEVIGVVSVAGEVLEKVTTLRPDIAIVDLRIAPDAASRPDYRHAIDLIRMLHERFPQMPILVTSFLAPKGWIVEAIKSGASGFLDKEAPQEELIEMLRGLRDGHVVLKREQMEWLMETTAREGEPLTGRELEVLVRLAQGMSNTEIANDLNISTGTVRVHVSRILHKLNVHNRHQAVEEARRRGLI